ncbi:uncharacterized protein ACN427_010322 isoform 1-T1 [Glossina fuscipes fuscipes]
MREIPKIKTENYCSMGEARRKYREINPSGTQRISKSNTYAVGASQNIPNKPLIPTPSNEKPVLPSTKNYIAKSIPSPAKDNIESSVLNSTQQITSCNESNLPSLNQPSISNHSRVPTRCTSNIRKHLSTDYSAARTLQFILRGASTPLAAFSVLSSKIKGLQLLFQIVLTDVPPS